MKKALIIIIFFLASIVKINASEVYYSDYSEFSNYQEEELVGNDLIDVEETYFYKYYKENHIGDYYIEGENPFFYPYIDKNDYYVMESDWDINEPDSLKNRIIETRTSYYYQEIKPIRYIRINKFLSSSDILKINEININYKNEKLNYEVICEGCNSEFSIYINNDIYYQENSFVSISGYIIIDLKDYYSLEDLTIDLYLTDFGTDEKRYEINTSHELDGKQYTYILDRVFFRHEDDKDFLKKSWNLSNILYKDPEFTEKMYSEIPISNSKIRHVYIEDEYRYTDYLYRYYDITREYYKNYSSTSVDDYNICDEFSKKLFYRSRIRDMIEIKKNLEITSYDYNLYDFILNSTISDITIETNLDIDNNGIYEISFLTPFNQIKKNIMVNIERLLEEFDEGIIEEPNDNKIDELNEKNIINDKVNIKKEAIIKDDTSDDNSNNIVKISNDNNTKLLKTDINIKKDNVNQNTLLNLSLCLIIFLLILLLIIKIIINKKSK